MKVKKFLEYMNTHKINKKDEIIIVDEYCNELNFELDSLISYLGNNQLTIKLKSDSE